MSPLTRWAAPFVLLLFVASSPGRAQSECHPLNEAVERALAGKALLEDNAEVPLAVASAKQVEAPSLAGGGSLVNLPGFASLLGVAQEQGLIKRADGVTSISLTPFSFLALARPQYSYNQELYEDVGVLRHIGGQLAFGGKGDSFDRDGDGMADEALMAEEFDDIVTWEVKYQFGTRDRRDKVNYQKYFKKVKGSFNDNFESFAALAGALRIALGDKIKTDDCYSSADLEAVLQAPVVADALAKLKASDAQVKEKGEAVFKDVDSKPLLTLVYGGTARKDKFGADKRSAALRGAFTKLLGINLGGTNSVELSWSEVESLLGVEDAITWKLGYNYSRSFLKGSELSKDGVTLNVAGSYEKLQDVPMAAHDTISKLNAKLKIPLHEGLEIPISVTWANHADLLTDEKEIQGHIGFTVDFSKLQEQLLGKSKKSDS